MSSTASSVLKLRSGVTRLAENAETMASTPLNPFNRKDAARLSAQGKALEDLDDRLVTSKPADLNQVKISDAINHVNAAQGLFDTINNSAANKLTDTAIFAVVDSAIAAVNVALEK